MRIELNGKIGKGVEKVCHVLICGLQKRWLFDRARQLKPCRGARAASGIA